MYHLTKNLVHHSKLFNVYRRSNYNAKLISIAGHTQYNYYNAMSTNDVLFKIHKTNNTNDKSRSGTLTTYNNKTITTPNILLYTHNGNIPYITQDIIHNDDVLNNIQCLHSSISDLISLQPPNNFYEQQHKTKHITIHNYLHLTNYSLYLIIHDTLLYDNTQISDNNITVNGIHGKQKLNAQEYNSIIQKFKPELLCSMYDSLSSSNVVLQQLIVHNNSNDDTMQDNNNELYSKNRVRKCIQRNLTWLDSSIQSIENNDDTTYKPYILANLHHLSYLSHEQITSYISELQKRNIHGYILSSLHQPYKQSINKQDNLLQQLDSNKLRIQSGTGNIYDILYAVYNGADLIECSYPHICTQLGYALTFEYDINNTQSQTIQKHKINLHDKQYEYDEQSLLPNCQCYACKHHSRAYIHHLLNVHELLSDILLQIHNLHHYMSFIHTVQQHVQDGTYSTYYDTMIKHLNPRRK